MIKILKGLWHISTLKTFYISNNNIGEEAANDIANVLSHNTQLKNVDISSNSFKVVAVATRMSSIFKYIYTTFGFL